MNIGNAYRRARNALRFEKTHFAATVQFDNIKTRHRPIKSKYKTQAFRKKKWHRILILDFPTWSRQIEIDLPHQLRSRQTANKMFISGLV